MRIICNSFSNKVLRIGQRGDTIVEVLIAISVVSLVLTSVYALTNKNVRSTQEVQEQNYAQKLAEQQVELLRAAATKPTGTNCFDPATGATMPSTSVVCKPIVGNATYAVAVTDDLTSTGKYMIQITWDKLGGGTSKVTVYYKVAS